MKAGSWLKQILTCLTAVRFGKSLRQTLLCSSILAISCIIIFKFFLLPVRIDGKSMEPTYRNGSFTFVNALRYRHQDPRRGDIVAIKMAGKKVMLLKRIIGLPGERLSFRDGALIVNGRPIPEEYLKTACDWNMPKVKIGSGEYFVAGDNRMVPIDRHALGRVADSKIIGGPLF